MLQRKRIILAFLTLVILGGSYGILRRQRTASPEVSQGLPVATDSARPSVLIRNGKLVSDNNQGQREWEAQFAGGKVDEETGQADLEKVNCILFEGGIPVTRLQIPKLIVVRGKGEHQLQMMGGVSGVSLVTGTKVRFASGICWWEQKRWVAHGNVEIEKGKARLAGDSLSTDSALKRANVMGHARLEIMRK